MSKPIYLYITPFFPSPKTWQGGFCLDAVRALKEDGRYEVVVMTAEDFGGDYEVDGVKVYQFPRVKIGAWEYFETFLGPWKTHLFLKKLTSIGISPKDVAVCHVHDIVHYIPYALAIRKLNPKCITLVHHHFAGYYSLRIGSLGIIPIWSDLLYYKMKREFEAVDAHVFISEHCKKCYCRTVDFDSGEDKGLLRGQLPWGRLYPSVKLKDSYVWYNGIDEKLFNPIGHKSANADFVVGCVANFHPCKRQIDLIQAVKLASKNVPNIKLKLVGDVGSEYETCRRYVREKNLSGLVEFVKPMQHTALPDFYRSLDLFVMPSVNEGFCCVNVEANACGVPFLAVKGLPMDEVLDPAEHEKWLVAPHDVEQLAKKIIDFAEHPCEQKMKVNLEANHLARMFCDWIDNKRMCDEP